MLSRDRRLLSLGLSDAFPFARGTPVEQHGFGLFASVEGISGHRDKVNISEGHSQK